MELLCSDPAIIALVADDVDAPCPNRELPYNRIFPYNYVPEITKDAATYICFDVEIKRIPNKTILFPDVYVWAFCHQSLMRLADGNGVRPDKLACEIHHVLNGSPCLGTGPLELAGLSSVAPIDHHWGKLLHYVAVDFNRPAATYDNLRGGKRGIYG
jgi:hypothetical protein